MGFSKRRFIKYGCIACSIAIFSPRLLLAQANGKNKVQAFSGQLQLNKKLAILGQEVKASDEIYVGAGSKATIFFNGDVYHLRENTTFVLPNESGANTRLVGGAVLAAFTPGNPKKIRIGDKTVLSIRGTGIYAESGPEKSEFCLCYGSANLSSKKSYLDIDTESKYHKDFTIMADGLIRPTAWHERRMTHSSRQNIELEKIAGRSSPFDGGYRDWISQFESPDL